MSQRLSPWVICTLCAGNGTHVNPSIDAGGLSAEDFDDDPDFAESYMRGDYDVQCRRCGGSGKIREDDLERAISDAEPFDMIDEINVRLPLCMAPDGAEPCRAFQRLEADNLRLRRERDDAVAANSRHANRVIEQQRDDARDKIDSLYREWGRRESAIQHLAGRVATLERKLAEKAPLPSSDPSPKE